MKKHVILIWVGMLFTPDKSLPLVGCLINKSLPLVRCLKKTSAPAPFRATGAQRKTILPKINSNFSR